ncbi:MAG: type II toxin-antitoxin system RelE/ParE family toxin [Bacilli bacterium]|nr:type II toxin-antitoxin system RelE/ParE family toxin [Bacilli bacterium]
MKRNFIELPLFRTKWEKLGLTDDDLHRLQIELLSNPKIGAVMRGTGGVRKMRFAFKHCGKTGSIRIIYVDFEIYEKIYLLTAYTKNEKDNLSNEERNEIRKLITILENQLKNN